MTTILLTDDEIVALSVDRGQPWPTALPTVPSNSQSSLWASANRGRRSLAVRELLDECGEGQPGLGLAIDGMLRSTRLAAVTASPVVRPDLVVGGGLAFGAPLGAAEWVCDTFTANGVHALDRCSPTEAVRRAVALGQQVFDEGVADLGEAAELGVAISKQGTPVRYAMITRGQLTIMEGTGSGDEGTFDVTSTQTTLDPALIAELLGAA